MMKLITLDFEGTLVDFQWKLAEAVAEALNALAEKGIPKETFSNMNYAGIYNLVRGKEEEWGFPEGALVSVLDSVYDKYDLDAASRWRPVEGLLEALEQLKAYKLALVSNVGRKGLEDVLPRFGLSRCFDLVVSRNDVRLLKPAAEGLLQAIERARVKREDVLHIGDSLADLHAARSAGVHIGVVLGGENRAETLLREKPDLVLEKFTDLPGKFKGTGSFRD